MPVVRVLPGQRYVGGLLLSVRRRTHITVKKIKEKCLLAHRRRDAHSLISIGKSKIGSQLNVINIAKETSP